MSSLFGFAQNRYTPEPTYEIAAGGNIYLRRMIFDKAGCTERGHSHSYDHLTFIERGKVGIEVAGRQAIYEAPCAIKIVAGEIHTIVAMEDGTVAYCLHALRDADNEEILPFGHCPFELDPIPLAAPLTRFTNTPPRMEHETS